MSKRRRMVRGKRCEVCSQHDNGKSLTLICEMCDTLYHGACLKPAIEDGSDLPEEWFCAGCAPTANADSIVCYVCHSGKDDDSMLLCDTEGCTRAQHLFCLENMLDKVPKGDWFCEICCKEAEAEESSESSSVEEIKPRKKQPKKVPQKPEKKGRRPPVDRSALPVKSKRKSKPKVESTAKTKKAKARAKPKPKPKARPAPKKAKTSDDDDDDDDDDNADSVPSRYDPRATLLAREVDTNLSHSLLSAFMAAPVASTSPTVSSLMGGAAPMIAKKRKKKKKKRTASEELSERKVLILSWKGIISAPSQAHTLKFKAEAWTVESGQEPITLPSVWTCSVGTRIPLLTPQTRILWLRPDGSQSIGSYNRLAFDVNQGARCLMFDSNETRITILANSAMPAGIAPPEGMSRCRLCAVVMRIQRTAQSPVVPRLALGGSTSSFLPQTPQQQQTGRGFAEGMTFTFAGFSEAEVAKWKEENEPIGFFVKHGKAVFVPEIANDQPVPQLICVHPNAVKDPATLTRLLRWKDAPKTKFVSGFNFLDQCNRAKQKVQISQKDALWTGGGIVYVSDPRLFESASELAVFMGRISSMHQGWTMKIAETVLAECPSDVREMLQYPIHEKKVVELMKPSEQSSSHHSEVPLPIRNICKLAAIYKHTHRHFVLLSSTPDQFERAATKNQVRCFNASAFNAWFDGLN